MTFILDIAERLADFIGDMADRILTPAGIVVFVLIMSGTGNLDKSLQGRVIDMAFGAMTPTVLKRTSGKVRETINSIRGENS